MYQTLACDQLHLTRQVTRVPEIFGGKYRKHRCWQYDLHLYLWRMSHRDRKYSFQRMACDQPRLVSIVEQYDNYHILVLWVCEMGLCPWL